MKIARFLIEGVPMLAVAATGSDDFRVLNPEIASIGAALAPDAGTALKHALTVGIRVPSGAMLLAPLDSHARIFCIGVNYRDHAGETGREIPAQPSLFTRTQESIVASGVGMQRPTISDNFDFEGELGVVMGRAGRYISQGNALDYIGGYTCFNDGSVRDYQKHSTTSGKNFEASGSCGPWVVLSDELPDPTQLTLVTRLNSTEVQRSTRDLLIHSIPRIIEYISEITSLLPGDVIATGTPAGVGSRRVPPLWMKPGDTVEVEISSVGTLRNPIVQEVSAPQSHVRSVV